MDPLTFHQALIQAEAQARSTLDVALHERLSWRWRWSKPAHSSRPTTTPGRSRAPARRAGVQPEWHMWL